MVWPKFAYFHCTWAETGIILLPVTNQAERRSPLDARLSDYENLRYKQTDEFIRPANCSTLATNPKVVQGMYNFNMDLL